MAPDRRGPYHDPSIRIRAIEAVQYGGWRDWYVKVTPANGPPWHYGPWLTEWAARALVRILAVQAAHRGTLDGSDARRLSSSRAIIGVNAEEVE